MLAVLISWDASSLRRLVVSKHAVILYTIGSPDTLTPACTKDYLNRFLSDKLVVKMPRFLWQPILQNIILRSRPQRIVKRYELIFENGINPYLRDVELLCSKLQSYLNAHIDTTQQTDELGKTPCSEYQVVPAYAYCKEGLSAIAKNFLEQGINDITVIPLFPQYSDTTSKRPRLELLELKNTNPRANLSIVHSYQLHELYIKAVSDMARPLISDDQSHVLFTYHSLPQIYITQGDPYYEHTQATTKALAKALNLPKERYSIAFQSKMGPMPWLKPYLEEHVDKLAALGVSKLVVIAPGFSTDCLETLYDLKINLQEQFLNHGGKSFTYVPCLNASDAHVELIANLLYYHTTKL